MSTNDDSAGAGAERLDDLLDRLVGEYSDALSAGRAPDRKLLLGRVPAEARPGLERALKMIEAGLAHSPTAAQPLAPGLQLDQYRLVRELGRGGMSLVWLATDDELKRAVAIKLLRPGLALEQRHLDRFHREGLAIAKLSHPHIVQIYGVGEARGYAYLAMEYVEGPSLATVLEALPRDRARTPEDLARAAGAPELGLVHGGFERSLAALLAPVADALRAAHERGLVHRDIKPSNILLRRNGHAVVADFGLAKGEDDPALSLTGDALGTPYYMSPEQAYVTGHRVDHRTDVYSLGVTLYEALSGERPFRGDSFLEVIEAIRSTSPPSLRSLAAERSKDATALVRRAMHRDPERRYADMAAMHADLAALAESRTTRALQAEGGPLGRAWSQLRLAGSGQPYEYRSRTTLAGWPLVHVVTGRRFPGQGPRVAKGWLAIGDHAYGGFALGNVAVGLMAVGGFSFGVLASMGGISLSLMLSMGGLSAGLLSSGGISLGGIAFGGIALGYVAIGGMARGVYAAGGDARGSHVYRADGPNTPEVEAFFENPFAGVWELLTGG